MQLSWCPWLQVSEEFALELLELQSPLKFDWKPSVPKLIHQVTHRLFPESLSYSLAIG